MSVITCRAAGTFKGWTEVARSVPDNTFEVEEGETQTEEDFEDRQPHRQRCEWERDDSRWYKVVSYTRVRPPLGNKWKDPETGERELEFRSGDCFFPG